MTKYGITSAWMVCTFSRMRTLYAPCALAVCLACLLHPNL